MIVISTIAVAVFVTVYKSLKKYTRIYEQKTSTVDNVHNSKKDLREFKFAKKLPVGTNMHIKT